MAAHPTDLTGLLKAWGAGDQDALEQLTPLVYGELRAQARRCMRSERSGATLRTTALVHEVYLRLLDADGSTGTIACISSRCRRGTCAVFGGLSVEETARILQVSPQSVMRDRRLARPWLACELGGDWK